MRSATRKYRYPLDFGPQLAGQESLDALQGLFYGFSAFAQRALSQQRRPLGEDRAATAAAGLRLVRFEIEIATDYRGIGGAEGDERADVLPEFRQRHRLVAFMFRLSEE